MKILIVDEDPKDADLIKTKLGYKHIYFEARNLIEGLGKAIKKRPGIAIIDINRRNGNDLLLAKEYQVAIGRKIGRVYIISNYVEPQWIQDIQVDGVYKKSDLENLKRALEK